MFPLNSPTVFQLVLVGVALASALAMRFGGRWRLLLFLVSVALPASFLWFDVPTGQYSGLEYVIVAVISAGMIIIGAILNRAARLVGIATTTYVIMLFVVSGISATYLLWKQYVPSDCTRTPIQVQIAGETLRVPPELHPFLRIGKRYGFFGRMGRKVEYAGFCRRSRNGTQAINVDSVSIYPASNYKNLLASCEGENTPLWCDFYSPVPYRHIGKIFIAPESVSSFPMPYWREGGTLEKERTGDLAEGYVCLLPGKDNPVTQCWMWWPFGSGYRITVSTNNLDQVFSDMPIEDARDMIIKVRDMTLEIIKPR